MLLLMVIALLVFGPSKLPGLGKSLGEGIRGFKKGLRGEDDDDEVDTHSRPQITKDENEPLAKKTKASNNQTSE